MVGFVGKGSLSFKVNDPDSTDVLISDELLNKTLIRNFAYPDTPNDVF